MNDLNLKKDGPKKPLHDAIAFRLGVAICGSNVDSKWDKGPIVEELLYILGESEMKAAHAHEVAANLAIVPEAMRFAEKPKLADLAEEVLADLRGRQDEKKQEPVPA